MIFPWKQRETMNKENKEEKTKMFVEFEETSRLETK